MKKIGFEVKFLIVFILIGAILFGGLLIYKRFKIIKLKEDSFKSYEYHNLVENASNISKSELINDPYLISLLRIDNYNGIKENDIEEIMKYYLLNITKNAAENISINDGELSFCMEMKAFIRSFKEFFGYDISDNFDYFENIDFITYSSSSVCFDLSDEVLYDYYTLIGIESIGTDGDVLIAKVYLYDLDLESEEEEKTFKNSLIDSVNKGDLALFNRQVPDYEEKEIRFKEIPNGDFFKYQVLYVKTK